MTITSIGYDGSIDEVQSANFFPRIGGADYGVLDPPTHWKLTPPHLPRSCGEPLRRCGLRAQCS